MQAIERHLRITGQELPNINTVRVLRPRYAAGLARAAHKASLIDQTLVRRLHTAPEGELILLPDEMNEMDSMDHTATATITLEHVTSDDAGVLGVTRTESSRGVKFGQLLIERSDASPIQELVAIKPTKVERAVREATAAHLINSRAVEIGMQTYTPIGFLKTDSGVSLITRFTPNTMTFDNVLWDTTDTTTEAQVADALAKSALSLATQHAWLRMTHGDAQPKNMSWNNVLSQPWGVDFEDARLHVDEAAWDFEDKVEADIATLMLYQSKMRSMDMFDLVAEKYLSRYADIRGERAPVRKDQILAIRNKRLQPLPTLKHAS